MIILYVTTPILVTGLLITFVRLVLYTKFSVLSLLTVFMIISDLGYFCWAYFKVQAGRQEPPYYG